MSETAAVILAAGRSTRMKSDLPKVLHEICGRPMLSFVLSACRLAGASRLLVVVGHGKGQVKERFEAEGDVVWVDQDEQNGTGHAVKCCQEQLQGFTGNVVVIAGDMPLVRRTTLAELIEAREQNNDAVSLATTFLDDPAGYGRIIRDTDGKLVAIVEHRNCTEEQRNIREVNPSYYCFDAERLFEGLAQVEANPETGEVYVTEAIRLLREAGHGVSATVTVPAEDAIGINTRLDLAVVSRLMQDRIQLALMEEGVTLVDPDNTWIEAEAVIGRGTTICPFSFIGAGAMIGERCRIGPFASIARGGEVPDETVVGRAENCGASMS
ncbi:MAG: NTP transferase domain-containing protein [Planctomycetes bacterium]|nr:NTP transferase domain-containing protein [Planctomycetota bacterium]